MIRIDNFSKDTIIRLTEDKFVVLWSPKDIVTIKHPKQVTPGGFDHVGMVIVDSREEADAFAKTLSIA